MANRHSDPAGNRRGSLDGSRLGHRRVLERGAAGRRLGSGMLDGVAACGPGAGGAMQTAAKIALFALLGAGAGALHCVLLRRTIDLIVAGSSALAVVLAMLGRCALTTVIFVVAGVFYGFAVFWMLAGFVVARTA